MPTLDQMYDEAIEMKEGGKLEEAVGRLEELILQDPDYVLAHAALSVFYGKMSRFDDAIEHAEKVCQLDPDDPFSFVAMSLVCQKAGRIMEAEQALRQAWRLQVGGG